MSNFHINWCLFFHFFVSQLFIQSVIRQDNILESERMVLAAVNVIVLWIH
jgi:hypothetical protein